MDARDMMKKYEIGQLEVSVKAKVKVDTKVLLIANCVPF